MRPALNRLPSSLRQPIVGRAQRVRVQSQPEPQVTSLRQKLAINTLDPSGLYVGMTTHFLSRPDPADSLRLRGGFLGEIDIEASVTTGVGRYTARQNLPDSFSGALEGTLLFSENVNRSFYLPLAEALLQRLDEASQPKRWGFGFVIGEYASWGALNSAQRQTGGVVRYLMRPTLRHQPKNSMMFSFTQFCPVREDVRPLLHEEGVAILTSVLTAPRALYAKALEILKKNSQPEFPQQELIYMKPFTDWAVHQAAEHQELLP